MAREGCHALVVLLCTILFATSSLASSGANAFRKLGVPSRLADTGLPARRRVQASASPPAGKVIAWGTNTYRDDSTVAGQLDIPADIALLNNVVAVAAGEAHALALLSTGQIVKWGANNYNQILLPALVNVIGIAAGGNHSVALENDGTVKAWGNNGDGQRDVPQGLGTAIQVAAACYHTLALLANGTVVAWGSNKYNESVVPPAAQANVIEISAGCWHNLARLRNGGVVAWGLSEDNRTAVPASITNATGISAGQYHSLVLQGGVVTAFGYNGNGQINVLSGLQNVVKVAGGGYHSLALLSTGEVKGWGWSDATQIPVQAFSNVVAIAAGRQHSLAIVGSAASPSPSPSPSPPPNFSPSPSPSPSPPPNFSPSPPYSPSPSPSPVPPPSPVPAPTSLVQSNSKSSSTAAIVGAVVGVAAGMLLLAALIIIWYKCAAPIGTRWWNRKDSKAGLVTQPMTGPGQQGLQLSQPAMDGKWGQYPTGIFAPSGTGDVFVAVAANNTAGGTNSSHGLAPSTYPWGQPLAYPPGSRDAFLQPGPHDSQGLDVTRLIWDRRLTNLKIDWADITIDESAILGQGGFGTVWKGMWQGTIQVAVKMLKLERLTSSGLEELRREALIMCEMPHPAIAPVYGLVDDGVHHALVMRLYKRGSVAAAISRRGYMQLGLIGRLNMAKQVASGMRSLHERKPAPIIHGDLKTSNLLVDDDGKSVAIADFGLACCLREGQSGQVVGSGALSLAISPPEVLEDSTAPRTTAGDVYAFGVVLLEIVSGRPAFKGMQAQDVMRVVKSGGRPNIPANLPADVAAIITACWAQEAAARPTFAEVVTRLNNAMAQAQQDGFSTTTTSTTLADLTTII